MAKRNKRTENKAKRLRDDDYILADGQAWFTVKQFSVRIHATDEGVIVDVYALGHEMDDALDRACGSDYEAEDIIRLAQAQSEDDRCEHGMFFSGAGACPKCGRGAE